jgi:hypothetical protein
VPEPKDPYRDDRATLHAENARLHRELAGMRRKRSHRTRVGLALLGLVVLDGVAFEFVRDMINAPRDSTAYAGMGALGLLVLINLFVSYWLFVRRSGGSVDG